MICGQAQALFADHRAVADSLAMLLSLACYAAAYALRRRPERAIVFIVLGGACIGVAMSMDDYLHRWDERFHALVGKNLGANPLVPTLFDDPSLPPGNWLNAHVWLHKPPLALWLIGGSVRSFGTCEFAVRAPSLLFMAAAVWATYRIGAALFSPAAGLVAASLCSLNSKLLELASGRIPTDHPDSVLISLVTLGVLAAVLQARSQRRGLAALVGAITGLALLAKWLPALLILGVWGVAMRWERAAIRARLADFALALVVCAAVAAPWTIYVRAAFPAEAAFESAYNWRHLWEPLEGHAGTPLIYLDRFPRSFGELAALPALWFLWSRVWRARERGAIAVAAWFAVPYLVFSLTATRMVAYVLIAAPAVFLMVAVGCCALQGRMAGLHGWRRPAAGALAAALLLLPARLALARWKPFMEDTLDREAAAQLRGGSAGPLPVIVLGVDRSVEARFYSEGTKR